VRRQKRFDLARGGISPRARAEADRLQPILIWFVWFLRKTVNVFTHGQKYRNYPTAPPTEGLVEVFRSASAFAILRNRVSAVLRQVQSPDWLLEVNAP
jgi:hypothetical protein